jgi:hypothetical protein
MAHKDRLSNGEWDAVVEAPMLAGFAVTAADPGGLVGALQESAAIVGVLRSAAKDDGSLAAEVSKAYMTTEGRKTAADGMKRLISGKSPGEASNAAIGGLTDIMAIVEGSVPEEAAHFRAFLIEVATRTADAAKEGGFLSFGGETVSADERAALEKLKTAIGA